MLCNLARIAASLITLVVTASTLHAEKTKDAANPVSALAKIGGQQQMIELPVRVIDPAGNPVADAKIFPWALRSSQGHGPWANDPRERAKIAPQEVVTNANGEATVLYPQLRDVAEGVQTIGVSLQVDHPEFAYADDLHIDVPLEEDGPYEIKLGEGKPIIIRPLVDGAAEVPGDLIALWSDGRSWRPDAAIEKLADGSLKIPALPLGKNSVLLVKLDGERATHFSKITDFELSAGKTESLDVPLRPGIRVRGALSQNVPRPVSGGRIKVETLPPSAEDYNRVMWFTWAPINPDGTFTIESWPAGEPMQLIALCDGYMADSGKAPAVVNNPRDSQDDFYNRPQVFETLDQPIEVAMSPLQSCIARAVDEEGTPVAGVQVLAGPNVGWWNHGSQIYCHPLVRGERLLRNRNYYSSEDKGLPQPFTAETNAQGEATLYLPIGDERIGVRSDVYELPAFLGARSVEVELTADHPAEVALRLQPRGTDKLGEWDKLAGVVFGCSTREGRRICALPGVQKKMEEFTRRFREAKDQQDPQLLAEAYAAVASAFTDVGDLEQAALWRGKAAQQADLAEQRQKSGKPARAL